MTTPKRSGVALVTGASSGIGEATALRLNEIGITTYAAARNVGQMAGLKERGIHVLKLDLTEAESIKACVDKIQAEAGPIDILVNNAGYGLYGSLEEVSLEDARRQFEVNLFGAAALTQLVIPAMRSNRSGKIINISSVGGVAASPYGGWYHATKFAVEGYSSSLRQELSPFGVDVIIVRPGAIKSGWRDIAGASMLKNSYHGPYEKAVQTMYAKYMSPDFDKVVKDPKVVAEVIAEAATARRPKPIYTTPLLARNLIRITKLLGNERLRDAFTRRFLGLPARM